MQRSGAPSKDSGMDGGVRRGYMWVDDLSLDPQPGSIVLPHVMSSRAPSWDSNAPKP